MKETFCPLPWMHLYAGNEGNLHYCCIAEEVFPRGVLNSQGQSFPIAEQNGFEAFWNSRHMRNTRRKMMKGQWPGACRRCKILEDQGIKSTRQHHMSDFGHLKDDLLKETKPNGEAPLRLDFLDLRLGNHCNLKCRMCGPKAAILWVDEWNRVQPESLHMSEDDIQSFKKMDWHKSEKLWKNLSANVQNLQRIHLAGGEPFLVPEAFEVLKECIRQNRARHIELSYNTNLTKLPAKLLELWPEFKKVRLMVSIDGFGSLNDYIRGPSKWSVVDENLQRIEALQNEIPQLSTVVCTTVQSMNLLYLKDLLIYLSGFKNIDRVPFLSLLREPAHFSVQVLPKELKELAEKRIKGINLETLTKDEEENLQEQLQGVLRFMNEKNQNDLWKSFVEISQKMDLSRNESLIQSVPEFTSYL